MPMKTKLTILGIILIILGLLCGTIFVQRARIHNLNNSLTVALNNNKAYELENQGLKDKAIEFQFTIDQIKHSEDSIINKLNEVRKQLKIKDKEVIDLQYLASVNQRKDSIVFVHDTLFQKGVAIDTLIGDKWSKLALHCEYPNLVNVDYSFNNETTVVVHGSRVTVEPPKKCFISRWFQKKQDIVEVDIVQENPYCTNKESKFIKIVK